MSDTHDLHFRIDIQSLPPADIFIHAGDFTKFSTPPELARFREFLTLLPYKHKLVVAGNHDFALDATSYEHNGLRARRHPGSTLKSHEEIAKLKQVCTYLEHESVTVEGVHIFGSPYSPEFYDWGFMYREEEGEKLWAMVPEKTDILVTHGPPFGVLDKNHSQAHCGCRSLLERVLQVKPQLHVFGHIHEDYGVEKQGGVTFANASLVNLAYKMTNQPLLFELEL
jgi:predicted phosphodiesterase